ncbi:hypothetical protein FJR45_11960 [Sulfurimonas sediminis]|uniref:Uncharacterized protein n=1 Tax=Sulfurimonas sediminis TaxID=2590020 RepID=A0A7M1B4F0_9BACT|nr:hypothetical protein [Sulfurimonas sediminis]QOP44617.1 hypothetical protein FJR45_11960 [Sulfurimonas sediminis]
MYKKVLSSSLIATALLLSGCGGSDTTCRIDVQNAIDDGNYDVAISLLEGECRTAYTQSDLNMNLASVYMGKSGYSVSDIADMLINSNDTQNDAFSTFISSVSKKRNPDSLPLLTKAQQYYLAAISLDTNSSVSELCSRSNLDLRNDSRLENACLYISFNDAVKATNTVTYLTGDVDKLVESLNNTNTTPYDMKASMDALAWLIDSNFTPNEGNITAQDVNISNKSYAHVIVNYGTNGLFYRLGKSTTRDANNSTVLTDGYCDSDGNRTACEGIEKTDGSIDITNPAALSCYACPVDFDGNGATEDVVKLLVDTFNNGTESITAIIDDPDITDSIREFKQDITNGNDVNITVDDIINYLNGN